ncbi:hypothetical protein FISHEDRAFT_58698 [Fistulina hepatica ATCC 64428]|uniref:Uncharacterized protein n=1 Tax=Fistulina hepatica ATCC 64428 TaxID=1128425 RepID=A0A0D7AD29_9AGAR|nr:hypothetical protein FISHEDRAFT_58698 [Fistulina hepatica ATCC 64428]
MKGTKHTRDYRRIRSVRLSALRLLLATLPKLLYLSYAQFSGEVLKEDFRTGLKELDGNTLSSAQISNERDPDNFNPDVDQRDYGTINLPVFTCSNRDHVQGDGDAACFSNVEDTGIPALTRKSGASSLRWHLELTRIFFNSLMVFCNGLHNYVAGIQGVTPADREALRKKWDSGVENNDEEEDEEDDQGNFQMDLDEDPFADIPSLSGLGGAGLDTMPSDFTEAVAVCTEDLKKKFQNGLEEKCRIGAADASAKAVETSDSSASSCHWQTYRARTSLVRFSRYKRSYHLVRRRHGVWRRDVNGEMFVPSTKSIASSWGKLFQDDRLQSFQAAIEGAINSLLKDFEKSATTGLRDPARIQAGACKEEAKAAMQKSMTVVAELIPTYDRAMEERGTGSIKRQKEYFHNFIDADKDDILSDGADVILDGLDQAVETERNALCTSVGELANRIEVNLSVLWESTSEASSQVLARSALVGKVNKIDKQVGLWRAAEQTQRDREDEERITREYPVAGAELCMGREILVTMSDAVQKAAIRVTDQSPSGAHSAACLLPK